MDRRKIGSYQWQYRTWRYQRRREVCGSRPK